MGRKIKTRLEQITGELQTIIDTVPSYIFVKDRENRFLRTNKAFADSIGIPVKELPGRSAFDFLPGEIADRSWEDDLEVISSGVPKFGIIERGWRQPHAEWYSMDKIPFRNDHGDIVGVINIATDITARQLSREKLRQKSALLESILNSLSHPFYVINVEDHTVAMANVAAGFGTEVEGKTCYELTHGRSKPCGGGCLCPLEIVQKTKKPLVTEHVHLDGEGESRSYEVHAYPLFDEDGEVSQVIEYTLEITERKAAEEALKESESRLQQFYDATFEGIAISENGRFLDVNNRMLFLFGYTREELIGREVMDLVAKEDRELVAERIKSNYDKPYEHRALHKNGTILFVEVKGQTVLYRGRRVRATTINDISERSMAVEALALSEEKYRALFEESRDSLFVITRDGRIIDANRAGIELLGLADKAEVLGLDFGLDVFSAPDEYARFMAGMVKHGFMSGVDIVLRYSDGRNMKALVSGNGIHDEAGDITAYRVSIRDVTEQKLLQEHLMRSQKLEGIGTLAGGIAHDINNLLTPIMAHVGYMQLALPKESPLREDLSEILQASDRARELVKHVLAFSREEQTTRKPVFLPSLVKETMKLIRASYPATIAIETLVEKDCKPVMADPTEIHQIIMNLCTNAEHALRNRVGKLKVTLDTVDGDEDPRMKSLELPPGRYARLNVTDTGVGMDERTKGRIFEPYFSTKEREEGSGLGLAVVHGIVAGYGGGISVESELDKGTSIWVYLPVLLEDILFHESEKAGIPRGSERILFIDDEKSILRIGKRLLESLGYTVTTEDNSLSGLERFKNDPAFYDLIITDQTQPLLTGTELMAEVLKIRPAMPVILCTGFSRNLSEERARELGAKNLVSKPFLVETLAQAVRDALDDSAQ